MASIRKHVTRDVVALDGRAPIRDAAQIMADQKIGSVAVKDGDRIVGLVTERDLVITVLARGSVLAEGPYEQVSKNPRGPDSHTSPSSMKTLRSPISRAKLSSWVTTTIVMPSWASSRACATP